MNEQERLSYLLARYANNECSSEEFDELFKQVGKKDDVELTQSLKAIWEQTDAKPEKTEAEWQALYAGMRNTALKNNNKVRFISWQKIAIAAMLFLVAATAWIVHQNSSSSTPPAVNKLKSVQELSPGGNKAVLTLANGEKIILDGRDNGTIASQTGVSITKTADGQLVYKISEVDLSEAASKYNTIEVPRGGQYQITMPDGTRVWLNSMSALKYPLHFSANERKVELTGEGYFEVAKNPKAPFRVKTETQVIEVMGTHFNVNAYQNESATRTTLVEGAVKVISTNGAKNVILAPGEQSQMDAARIVVKEVDTEVATAWKNGTFMFNNDNLGSIMRQIARWYDVDVVYKNNAAITRLFSGSISRFENASQVLEILELTGLVHFKIEGRRIIVM